MGWDHTWLAARTRYVLPDRLLIETVVFLHITVPQGPSWRAEQERQVMGQLTKGIYRITQIPALHGMLQHGLARPNSRERLVNEIILPTPGAAVLDLGCGAGEVMPLLDAGEYIGVDVNPAHIAAAKHKYPEADFRTSDAISFVETVDKTFDLITMIGLLHHLDDDKVRRVMRGAKRILKPNGKVVAFDVGFEPRQNPIAYVLAKLDSGRNVRTLDGFLDLEREVFPSASGYLRHDLLRVPYTHVITICQNS